MVAGCVGVGSVSRPAPVAQSSCFQNSLAQNSSTAIHRIWNGCGLWGRRFRPRNRSCCSAYCRSSGDLDRTIWKERTESSTVYILATHTPYGGITVSSYDIPMSRAWIIFIVREVSPRIFSKMSEDLSTAYIKISTSSSNFKAVSS